VFGIGTYVVVRFGDVQSDKRVVLGPFGNSLNLAGYLLLAISGESSAEV
jgi:hypothetical protein